MKLQSSHTMQREANRNHVIEVATKAFHSQGIKCVTMDDIAHQLTMSKRTLYQLFSDKEELLLACIKKHQDDERQELTRISEQTENVLDLILASFAIKMHEMDRITPEFYTDIMKYPNVVAYFEKLNKERESEAVSFLNKGIEQGYFRDKVNFHIVYNVLSAAIDGAMRTQTLNQYTQRELFVNTILTFIRGCATLKGIEIIDKFVEKYHSRIQL